MMMTDDTSSQHSADRSIHSSSPMATLSANKVTKHHWIPDSEATECYNLSCRKTFSFFERKHHCRRCGHIFCAECSSYELKLGLDAEPCSVGVLCRVCNNCYAEAQVEAFSKPKSLSYTEGSISSADKARKASAEVPRKQDIPHVQITGFPAPVGGGELLPAADVDKRPRESSTETLVNAERKDDAEQVFLTRRRRTQEFLERRLCRRPSQDEIAEKMKEWNWSTF